MLEVLEHIEGLEVDLDLDKPADRSEHAMSGEERANMKEMFTKKRLLYWNSDKDWERLRRMMKSRKC
jgi:hypothetical protein